MFEHELINFPLLKQNAYNYRWAEVPEGVIPLTAADSDFPCAPEIVEGLKAAVETGYFCYTPKLGYPSLCKSIADKLNERKNEHVDSALVLPIDSAARGMYVIAEVVLQPGDEAIVFDPVDYLFGKSTQAAGGKCVLFPSKLVDNKVDVSDLESYITPKTRMIGLCNPHNPLGALYTKEALQQILDLAEKYDLYIMNDEIWSDIVYPPNEFLSILNVDPSKNYRVISVYGFSKSFSVAGLRAGCIYAHDKAIFEKLVEASAVMTTAGGISSLSQIAAQICMDKCYYWNEAFVRHTMKNRDYALDRISKMKGITCHRPDATFLLFPNISATGMDSGAFVEFLEKTVKLAIVPGTPKFFGPGAEGHVRICLATSLEVLEEAMNRLEKGLDMLMKS